MKNRIFKLFFIAILFIPVISAFAQQSVVAGKIVDKASGETLIGATIVAQQNGAQVTGTVTDFDGVYSLEVAAGVYDMVISYTGYAKQTITGFEVKEGAANNLDIALEGESLQLAEVVVTASAVKNTDAALITLQRKAFAIQDGVSSQQISRTGSSNAADAMRQMTGAVVEGGRFIVMRGLGDRYSLSQLNGITLPSTDPYRNSASLDLIPSQMIDNIVTLKTFTPDLPGNFSGGLVNINTKTFPDKLNVYLQVGAEYNTQSTYVDNFLTQEKGDLDWLGLDDGSRDQPSFLEDLTFEDRSRFLSSSAYLTVREPDPKNENARFRQIFQGAGRELSQEFVPRTRTAPLNSSVNFSIGNKFKVFNRDLGFNLGVNYGSSFLHYDDGQVATYIYTNPQSLFDYQELRETKSTQNPQLGVLFNLAYKLSENNVITGNIIFNNDAEIVGRQQVGTYNGQLSDRADIYNTNSLEFTQRQFITYQVTGKHVLPGWNNAEIEWLGSRTSSFQEEPDLRFFAYAVNAGDFSIRNAEFPFPSHFFRRLDDKVWQGKLDISIPFLTKGNAGSSNRIKLGGFFSNTEREFGEYRYQLNNSGVDPSLDFGQFRGNFDAFFSPSNFGIVDTITENGNVQRYVTGYHYINQINRRNFYNGAEDIFAAYLMSIYNLSPKLKAVAGIRLESTNLNVQSLDTSIPESTIDLTDLLYSLNFIYSLSEKTNIRIAGSQTLARPNMRELAPFEQFDVKNGFFNVGNPNLKRTLIQNYDIRFETYPRSGELLAISGFFKRFQNPIIRAFNPQAGATPELTFINVDEANVFGAELEFRKNLDFIGNFFTNFYFSTNLALIQSEYDVPENEVQISRTINPNYNTTTRPFQGQAPYIVNLILSYINPDRGWETSLAFNVTGEKLYNIALFATPDVYEQPVPIFNFKLSKRFAERYQVNFLARNILNPINKRTQSFAGREYIAEGYKLGTALNLSIAYSIR